MALSIGSIRAGQRGVALISILLLLTVLATLAIYAAEDQDLAIRRVANLDMAEQGYQVNLSGEQWVIKVLEKDQQDDKIRSNENDQPVDHAGEIWGNLGPPVEVGETGTTLLMLVEDLQGRLNLNNLIQGKERPRNDESQNVGDESNAQTGSETPEGVNPPADRPDPILWFQIFQRLFAFQDLNPELVDAVIDWIDADENQIGTTGAEDLFYTGLELPYRSANRIMASSAELASIKDMDSTALQKILPFVAAIPLENAGTLSKVNVNTAPSSILALFASDPALDPATLIPLIEFRQARPFLTVAEYAEEFNAIVPGGLAEGALDMLGTTSDYYAGRSCAQSGRVKFSMTSLLKKQAQAENVKVLQRERYFGCPAFPAPADSDTKSLDDKSAGSENDNS